MRMDLNADVGEAFGAWQMGEDARLVEVVTSVNIACGAHAGDPAVMRRTVRLARDAGASIGAHPGFPDLQGFGRREMHLSPGDIEDTLLAQIGALAAMVRAEAARLGHVKVHGALYNMAVRDEDVAEGVARAVAAFDRSLAVVAPAGSCMARRAEARGLRVLREAFVDRAYRADGTLVPRRETGALITDPEVVARRALALVRGEVTAVDGTSIRVVADTLCIHGDTAGAPALARLVRDTLEREGVTVAAPVR